ncbi:MAG TPA: GGDEF domain-containing protein [Nitrospira sp.]
MSSNAWKTFLALVMPGGFIFIAAIGFLRPQGLPAWLHQPISALPYIVLVFGLIFGWYFSHTRMILSLLALTLTDLALCFFPMAGNDPNPLSQTIFSASAILLPLNLLAFSLLKDDSILTIRGLFRLLAVLVQPFLVLWLCYPEQQEIAATFRQAYLTWVPMNWTPIPQAALLVYLVAGLMQLIRFVVHRDPFDGGSVWALATVFFAFHGQQFGWQATNFFSTAGLILFVALIQSSYQRTYRDDLTGIAGRLAYEEATAQLGKQFAVAVLSIDQLKPYANTLGRSVAKQILKLVAPKVQAACHDGRVFRISGEELTLLFPNHSAVETLAILEQIRKTVEGASLYLRGQERVWEDSRRTKQPGRKDRELPLSVSIGVAEKAAESATLSLVIKSAYRALYDAKLAGGNVVKRGAIVTEPVRRSAGTSGRMVANSKY